MRSSSQQSSSHLPSSFRMLPQQRGLTRLQLLVALAVVAIIAAVAVPRLVDVFTHAHKPEVVAAEKDIDAIALGLQHYKRDTGDYPSSEQGLLALIVKPTRSPVPMKWQVGGYLDRLPRDPWGHPYQYRVSEDGQEIDVFSFGAKGPDGGEDSDSIVRGTAAH